MKRSRIIAAVDTGGTFTDFVFVHEGVVFVDKRPSRPKDPVAVIAEGVSAFLRRVHGNRDTGPGGSGEARSETAAPTGDALIARHAKRLLILHGTTVPTNALLEGKAAKTCLVTNKGFEDVIEIGRQERRGLFRLPAVKVASPVPRRLRFGVRQRTLHDGREEAKLSAGEVRAVAARAARSGARAAAVSLLYSFLNPRPEERLGRALRRAGLAVSLSSQVAPEFREYERTATTVVNASLKPVMEGYLARLEEVFPGAAILVMCSTGGVVPPAEAAERPVAAILSGPAGGVAGSVALLASREFPGEGEKGKSPRGSPGARGRRGPNRVKGAEAAAKEGNAPGGPRGAGGDGALVQGLYLPPGPRAITFDMGGTSTDVALIDGEPLRRHQSSILGLPLLTPSVDIHTVGAGGGSMIRIDEGGALRVGPESTGADPGPACYGKALLPALTDAHVALGRLDAAGLLGGGFPIDPARSARALLPLAERLHVTPAALCRAVLDVADAVVEKAIRVITLGRGRDPRDFPLVAFGGAGGLHACRLMLAMDLPAVIVPPAPGVLSAAGIAAAELKEERSRGFPLVLSEGRESTERLKKAFARLEEEWRRERGVTGRVKVVKEVDLRYLGQSFDLTLPFDRGRRLAGRFHEAHLERYGHSNPAGTVEAVTIRARFLRRRGFPPEILFGAGGEESGKNGGRNGGRETKEPPGAACRGESPRRRGRPSQPGRLTRPEGREGGRAGRRPGEKEPGAPSPHSSRSRRTRDARRSRPHGRLTPLAGFGSRSLPLYRREALRPGDGIGGPAVVTEYTATTIVEKGCLLHVDETGSLVIRRGR